MSYWIYMHINFLILDPATALIPVSFLTFFVLPWAIINVEATIYPFELILGFYRWAYALPAHEFYSLVIRVESGCGDVLYRVLPILFSREVVGLKNRHAEAELIALGKIQKDASKTDNNTLHDEEQELTTTKRLSRVQ
ncbi:putative nitrosoguanidine resistance protein [Botrytis fragariae]|uniref:Putative nitrosoguanidine resistance protein n=1 Tax=Botrytis fragariae TaxID=1964551 RepID=A0A8H6B3Y6_9HELO|nr:putative nitrosoguanidine resistance protein [Botrytis fragariae]KAF5879008.1 putative nitrosoguanidine resistance protein [Botrytis fragariae]